MTSPLIIGIGTPDRGDDAAGFIAAARLRERGFNAIEHSRDGLALIDLWEGRDHVILIDATVSGLALGAITKWDATTAPVASDAFRATHSFGVAEAIRLAKALGKMPAQMWIYGIEGTNFAPAHAASPEIVKAATLVAEMIST